RVPPDAGVRMITMAEPTIRHDPVMPREVIAALNVQPGGRYVDCTLGGGGHSRSILEAAAPGGTLLGLDADPEALTLARYNLRDFGDAFDAVHANFRDIGDVCRERGFAPVNGILFDLGLSSYQLASTRGFSFRSESPLDMRFDSTEGQTAAYWVNEASEED